MHIYGTLIHTFKKCTGNHGGCLDLTIEIYETKTTYKAVLWDSSFLHWRSGTHQPIHIWYWNKDAFVDEKTAVNAILEQHGWNISDKEVYHWDDISRTSIKDI